MNDYGLSDCSVVLYHCLAPHSMTSLSLETVEKKSKEELLVDAFYHCDVLSVEALLLEYPDEINRPRKEDNNSLIHVAIEKEKWDTVDWIRQKKNANLNLKNKKKKTPLLLLYEKQINLLAHKSTWQNLLIVIFGRNTLQKLDKHIDSFIDKNNVYLNSIDLYNQIEVFTKLRGLKGFLQRHLLKKSIKKLILHRINNEKKRKQKQDDDSLGNSTDSLWNIDDDSIMEYSSEKKNKKIFNYLTKIVGRDVFFEKHSEKQKEREADGEFRRSAFPLHEAIAEGKLDRVRSLVQEGTNLNLENTEGELPLVVAIDTGQWRVIKYLIEEGVDIDFENRDGKTSLDVSIEKGHIDIAKDLIKEGFSSLTGEAPLCCAIKSGNMEMIKYLFAMNSFVRLENKESNIPLYVAIERGDIDIIGYLIEEGADVMAYDDMGKIPLMKAVVRGNIIIVKYLVERGADVSARDDMGKTPLMKAVVRGNIIIVKYLVERGADVMAHDNMGETSLMKAAVGGDITIVKYLIDSGADVRDQDNMGKTPLMSAVEGGDRDIIEDIVDSGADVRDQDNMGKTPLMSAVEGGDRDIIEDLVDSGADVKHQDERGMTPLIMAIKGGDVEIVKYLVEHGVDVKHQDERGMTPLIMAIKGGYVEIVKYLVEHGADVKHQDERGMTPLIMAIKGGYVEIVKYLVEHGADVKHQDERGMTPLIIAVEGGHVDIVQFFLNQGEIISNKVLDADEGRILHVAIRHNNLELIQILVANGADFTAKDRFGKSIFFKAIQLKSLDIVQYLVQQSEQNHNKDYLEDHLLGFSLKQSSIEIADYLAEKGATLSQEETKTITHQVLEIIEEYLVEKKVILSQKKTNTMADQGIKKPYWKILEFLVKQGLDKNIILLQGDILLRFAIVNKNLKMIQWCIELGVELDGYDPNEEDSYLLLAVEEMSLDIVKYLVDNGVDMNYGEILEETPFHMAVQIKNFEIARFFIERGVNEEDVVKTGNLEMIEYLIENEKDKQIQKNKINRLLPVSVEEGDLDAVKYFLKSGADIDQIDLLKKALLEFATDSGDLRLIRFLVEQGVDDQNIWNTEKYLFLAVQMDSLEMVKWVWERGDEEMFRKGEALISLKMAINRGHMSISEYLLDNVVDINGEDERGQTCLSLAIKSANLRIVRLLIEKGSDRTDLDEKTMFNLAVERGSLDDIKFFKQYFSEDNSSDRKEIALNLAIERGDLEIVEYFLQNGFYIKKNSLLDQRPFLQAIELKDLRMARLFFETGVDIEEFDKEKILYLAIEKGTLKDISAFVKEDLNFQYENDKEETAMNVAINRGDLEIVKYLFDKGVNIQKKNSKGKTPLSQAIRRKNLKIIKFLVEKDGDIDFLEEEVALHLAIEQWTIKDIEFFVDERGVNIDYQNWKQETALHLAIERGDLSIIQYLVGKQADIDKSDADGETCFFKAVKTGDLRIVQFFVEKLKVIVDQPNKRNKTPLHVAIERGNLEIVKYLVQNNANIKHVHQVDKEKWTCLFKALKRGDMSIVKFLVEEGADIKSVMKKGINPLHVAIKIGTLEDIKFFVQQDNTLNDENNKKEIALHLAAERGDLDIFKHLVDNGAKIDQKDKQGESIWFKAKSPSILQYLIEQGANINETRFNGKTVLQEAIEMGNIRMAQFYMEQGADVNLVDANGRNAFHRAIADNRLEMIRLCFKHSQVPLKLDEYRDKEGESYIHWAYKNKAYQVLQYFCEEKGGLDIQNTAKKTVFELATEDANQTCLKMFNNIVTRKKVEIAA